MRFYRRDCYYTAAAIAAILRHSYYRVVYVCGIYNRMRFYRRECYYTAAAIYGIVYSYYRVV